MFKYTDYITFKELLSLADKRYIFSDEFLKTEELDYLTLISYKDFYAARISTKELLTQELSYIKTFKLLEHVTEKLQKAVEECLSTQTT